MNILQHILRRPEAPEPPGGGALPAAHLSDDRNRVIGFADIAALPEPDWATGEPYRQFEPGRYAVEALVPAGQIAAVVLDDDSLTARLDAMAAVWFDAQFEDDDTEGEVAP